MGSLSGGTLQELLRSKSRDLVARTEEWELKGSDPHPRADKANTAVETGE